MRRVLWLCLLGMSVATAQVDERPKAGEGGAIDYGYTRRVVYVPMRDGIKLHTVIAIPKGGRDLGMLVNRSLDGEETESFAKWPFLTATADDAVSASGYIQVFQSVRGKGHSEGGYGMHPPAAGTLFNPTQTDDSTDAWDTIDWLVKNVPESNGRVGVIGNSYDGFTTLMAIVNPHPAIKVAVAMSPMVDAWRGDAFFHNGAFAQQNMYFIHNQLAAPGGNNRWVTDRVDDYEYFLHGVSAGAIGKRHGMEALGFWRKIIEHPAYDEAWTSAAVDRLLAKKPLSVPVMLLHSFWDQEDIYGALAVYKAIKLKDVRNDTVFLTLGPWRHGQQAQADASRLGALAWNGNTALWWRKHVLAPFLAHHLRSDAPPMDVAMVTAFETGANEWRRLERWPPIEGGEARLYLQPVGKVGFEAVAGPAATADYISDPSRPVSYTVRPVARPRALHSNWEQWLVDDQRAVSGRPDVLVFESALLTVPVTIRGQPLVNLTASTSGSDSDWVVKLIDVYPDGRTMDREMAGYQLPVAMEIFRGRYREDLSVGKPLQPNVPLKYRFALTPANHTFLPGHRIMVHVQSSWFPLYDRNPQTFVPNIFFAKPHEYVTATQKVTVAGPDQSFISLHVVE